MSNNLIGQKFGKLTVISRANNSKRGKKMWYCKCDCGKDKLHPVLSYDLKSGKVKSCGCLNFLSHKGINSTHGMSNTRIYKLYCSLLSRCYYEKNVGYENYGGRGIRVCDEWKNDFMSFYTWAKDTGYDEFHNSKSSTLDRIDPNGNYEPNNCRWATMKTQQNNRRNNRIVEINGVEKTLSQWSDISGISGATIRNRVVNGWDTSELLIEPKLNNKWRKINNGKL